MSSAKQAGLMWAGCCVTIALHLSFSNLYGYQRDELYFMACARRLAWGYVDQPPLIAVIAAGSQAVFGTSLLALRLLPAAAAGLLVALSAYTVRRIGGGPWAVLLVMVCVALAPFDLAVGSLLTMNAFEPLFWLGLTLLAYVQLEDPRRWRWAAIGIVAGSGMLNKWSMGMYTLALLAGLALSPLRRRLFVPGLAGAAFVAGAIVAPNVVWQAAHGWPQLEVLQTAARVKNERITPAMFLLEQLPLMNPLCAPLWIAGLFALLRSARYAGFALAYGVLVATELVLHGKVYYVAPVYPALIAVGAVVLERATRTRPALRVACVGAIVLGGCAIMPLATPTLPLDRLLAYQHILDVRTVKMEDHPLGLVPQQFADQLGWDELETTIARVVRTLAPTERASAAILTGDYGQAAALEFLGRRDGLPAAISGHNAYFLWGPHGEHQVIVAIGVPRAVLAQEYRSIEQVGRYESRFVLPQNSRLPIYLCRRPRVALARFWPRLRVYQ